MRIKSFMTSCLLLATLLVSNQKLSANWWSHEDSCCDAYSTCCDTNFDPCCCDPCDCCESPYAEGRWSASVNSGVVPVYFLRHSDDRVFFPFGVPAGLTFPQSVPSRRFDDQWNLPWIVGLELGYMFCCDWEIFFDFDFATAKAKHLHRFFTGRTGPIEIIDHANRYRSYDYYLGTRYYFPTLFCFVTPFAGAKVGLVQFDGIRTRCPGVTYKTATMPSGGFQLGFNVDLTCNLALTFKAEALFDGGWESSTNTVNLPNPTGIPTTVVGDTGPVLRVPCTIGIRYSY